MVSAQVSENVQGENKLDHNGMHPEPITATVSAQATKSTRLATFGQNWLPIYSHMKMANSK
eukprot:1737912-Ditylum_brightwellii.AAC.1